MLFCGFDHEQRPWDHPLPAAKRAANLSRGEPRTVRMIYFLPSDRPFRSQVVEGLAARHGESLGDEEIEAFLAGVEARR